MKRRKVNPWAVCGAMKKKHHWSKKKTERCVRAVKKVSGYRRRHRR